MWICHKCRKPVYFAERKQSMGYDWHPECLKCEECGKILKPGQHAEHKGVPYCHVPCYGALFGPQLFGHGTRVESHKSFGKIENKPNALYGGNSRNQLETTVKAYNHYYDVHGGSGGVKSREVNGRFVLEGVLRLYWGVHSVIQLKEDDDQRLSSSIVTSKYRRRVVSNGVDFQNEQGSDSDSENDDNSAIDPSSGTSELAANNGEGYRNKSDAALEVNEVSKFNTVPSKFDVKQQKWDELDELLKVEREWKEHEKAYQTLPNNVISVASQVESVPGKDVENSASSVSEAGDRSATKSNALRRRPGRRFDKSKLKRRCSINGHYYNRETSIFTPPYGSTMSVWTTSLVNTKEVINMLLDKYRVECPVNNFSLFLVKDNGERRRLREDEYPLLVRVTQGPDESVAKLFLVEREGEDSHEVSAAVAQFLHLSEAECKAILRLYCEEEEREVLQIKNKHKELKRRIKKRMEELKVKL